MAENITGASVWEQSVYDQLRSHAEDEGVVLHAYEELASDSESKAFGYLAGLILDDERRHHRLLDELAESIKRTAELSGEPLPVPDVDFAKDRDRILAATDRLLALEEEDNRELRRLKQDLHDVRNTTLWELVLDLMAADNEKHRRILGFIRDHTARG